ncbi:MAG: baseplate J/gp47 family protein [Nitrospirae bacterium]|nr:baseplate J/gp47 family protein [Nitrospirota bacterium]
MTNSAASTTPAPPYQGGEQIDKRQIKLIHTLEHALALTKEAYGDRIMEKHGFSNSCKDLSHHEAEQLIKAWEKEALEKGVWKTGKEKYEDLGNRQGMASALWGIYKGIEWTGDQIFPDTADSGNLDHHGWVRGIERTYEETDEAYLARLLDWIRRPPAGGNKYDYIKWEMEIDNIAAAYCFPLAQGLGTVDVVIVANEANTGSEIPSSSARIGKVTTVSANKLIDGAADFAEASHPVSVGDIVRNPVSGIETTVVSVDSASQLTLTDDIFKAVSESYILHNHTGENTAFSAGKLVDANAKFNDATWTIKKGDKVENITDGTETTVVSVDSATQLALADDIFEATAKKYKVISLIAEVKSSTENLRPVTASVVRILPPTILTQNIDIEVTGQNANKSQAAADIEAYLKTLIPGQTLYKTQLVNIAIDNGADDVTITTPANNVVPGAYEMIRPGVISVT